MARQFCRAGSWAMHHRPLKQAVRKMTSPRSCKPFPAAPGIGCTNQDPPWHASCYESRQYLAKEDSHEEKIGCSGRAAPDSRINCGNRSIRTGGLWTPSSPPSSPSSSLRGTTLPTRGNMGAVFRDYRGSLHSNPSIGREAFARRACGRYGRPYGDGISRSGRKAEDSEAGQGGGGPGTSSWPFNVYLFSLKSFTHVSTTSGS